MRLALIFVLASCTTNNTTNIGGPDAATTGPHTDAPGTTPTHDAPTSLPSMVTPTAGTWLYGETMLLSNTCGSAGQHAEPSGTFVVDMSSTTGFRITPSDNTAPFTCVLGGASFTCPDRVAGTYTFADTVVTLHATADGTFTDDSHATGQQHGTATCTGSGCSAIATFPCTATASFAITGP